MSWFTRAITNTLNLDDEEDDPGLNENENDDNDVSTNQKHEQQFDEDDSLLSPGQGVKEDLSQITETLTRQFWGVASFLAPPPTHEHSNEQSDPESDAPPAQEHSNEQSEPESDAGEAIAGLRREIVEIGGRFRSGISKLSSNIDVAEITKLASSFLQIESDDGYYDSTSGSIGITEDVVAFVRDIAMYPNTWLDFPLPHDGEDFHLSDAQQEHAFKIERLAPRLAALRNELCAGYMSESSFWKIYFVLLHPKLESHAAELLSTPEILETRASLTHELKNHSDHSENISNAAQDKHISVPPSAPPEPIPREISPLQSTICTVSDDSEIVKHPIPSDEIETVADNSLAQEETRNGTKPKDQNMHPTTTSDVVEPKDEDEDANDWLKEESSETVAGIPIENDEDVSFSDLEDDEDVPTNHKKASYGSDSSTKDS